MEEREGYGYSVNQWLSDLTTFNFDGVSYGPFTPNTTLRGNKERIGPGFAGMVRSAYGANAVVFSCERVRVSLFSQARFQFRRVQNGKPGDLFGTSELRLLETPWSGGTTGDLLARMALDADFAGNSFVARRVGRLQPLRPDWMTLVYGSHTKADVEMWDLDSELIGYVYQPGGPGSGKDPVALSPFEVAHFAPMPDPLAPHRGMSWLTPVVREILADSAATSHKLQFFEHAAPQPLTAKVLTPNGWTTMGAVRLGDEVTGADGEPHRVIGVYPQGEQEVYRLTFSDGGQAECSLNHVWQVTNNYDRQRGVVRHMTLAELLADGLQYESGPAKWSVPMADPVEFESVGSLPLNPYLLGLLLGDGSFRGNGKGSGGVSLACHKDDADETVETIGPMLPDGVTITDRDRGGWRELYFKGHAPHPNPLTSAIKQLGLYDLLGADKFIPESYLRSNIKDRVALLQGLVDSDGHVDRVWPAQVSLTTKSERLAHDLGELVMSLGGLVSTYRHPARGTLQVKIKRLPDWVIPARLLRKADRYRPSSSGRHRAIAAVEKVGSAPTQCIRLDSDDHLYITDDYIVTHNTPNMVVKLDANMTKDVFERWVDLFEAKHAGVANAYKTLYLAGGADTTVVGANLQQMDFKVTQGAGETRIAAASGIHPVIVGLSEGLQGSSLNAGNFAAARRSTADITLRPLWQNAAGSLARITNVPPGSELWYDEAGIAFLQEDAKDAVDIEQVQAATIRQLLEAGFVADAVIDAVMAQDMSRLRGKHSGLFSIQLQAPGSTKMPEGEAPGEKPVGGGTAPEQVPGGNGKVPAKTAIPPVG
jgi:hypothetical protein